MSESGENRYLIVSNRLPVTAAVREGKLQLSSSAGGLATALAHVHGRQGSRWIGWPGDTAAWPRATRKELDEKLAERAMAPVHLTAHQVERFYEGFCNGVLWPLFHYLLDKVRLDAWKDWEAYREANERFADAVVAEYQPGDRIWVHDYHLLLLPALLRKRLPEAAIAFFLHIPFPASSVFRILPWRKEILEGLLGSDLIGFHTHSYQRQFRSCLLRLLGLDAHVSTVPYEGRLVRIGAFPISIDTRHFMEAAQTPAIFESAERLRRQNENCKIVLGVDRLDYTKGLRRRVLAVERLLERAPELKGKFRLVQIAAPSRVKVEAYRQLRHSLDELVGRVNGRFSTVDWSPVQYLFQTMSEDELVPLYQAAHAMLVTPTRDGMNLVAKEFVACREDNDGVLILSEFTGAAWELGEALLVNPYDVDQIAQAIHTALVMPEEERHLRMRRLRDRVKRWTVHDWVGAIDKAFSQVTEENSRMRQSTTLPVSEVQRIHEAEHLVLILDYDGTLVPFAALPELAAPDPELHEILNRLAKRPGTEVFVVSGRERHTLGRWFEALPLTLYAEHGLWKKAHGQQDWEETLQVDTSWKDAAREIMEDFAARTPGALVEEKHAALCWHYRRCEPIFAQFQERELRMHLADMFNHQPVEVLTGSKVVELRQMGVHKGVVVSAIEATAPKGSLLVAIGDDTTDEDMFAQLPEGAVSIHVGSLSSRAKYRLAGPAAVRTFLRQLAEPTVEYSLHPMEQGGVRSHA